MKRTLHPFTGRNKGEAFQLGERLFLHAVIAPGPVNPNADGVGTLLRAIMAFAAPAVAPAIIKIRTMPGKRPAIVQCPQHGPVHLPQGFKEHRQVQIASMQVMQMNNIRVKLL